MESTGASKGRSLGLEHEVPFLSSQCGLQREIGPVTGACWEHRTNYKEFLLRLAAMTRRKVSFQKKQDFSIIL